MSKKTWIDQMDEDVPTVHRISIEEIEKDEDHGFGVIQ